MQPAEPVSEIPAALKEFDAKIRDSGEIAISYKFGQVSVAKIIEAFHASGGRIGDLRTEEPDLEDVFLALTYHRGDAA